MRLQKSFFQTEQCTMCFKQGKTAPASVLGICTTTSAGGESCFNIGLLQRTSKQQFQGQSQLSGNIVMNEGFFACVELVISICHEVDQLVIFSSCKTIIILSWNVPCPSSSLLLGPARTPPKLSQTFEFCWSEFIPPPGIRSDPSQI